MEQESLWYDTVYDALRACVRAIASARHPGLTESGSFKVVGAEMFPSLSPERAGQLIANKLNPDARDVLHPDEMLWLLREARKVGCHVGLAFISSDTGYAPPQPIEPKDEMAELQKAYIQAVEAQKALIERMERVQSRLK